MATKEVKFKVTPSGGIKAYWIRVGSENITLMGGKGSILLQTVCNQILIWHMVGNPGSSLGIVGEVDDLPVVKVEASKIPSGEHEGAGTKRFQM